MPQSIVVWRTTGGVLAKAVGMGDRHTDIGLEDPSKNAAVQDPECTSPLDQRETTVGDGPPNMLPRGAGGRILRPRGQNVCGVGPASLRETPHGTRWGARGHPLCDRQAGRWRAMERQVGEL